MGKRKGKGGRRERQADQDALCPDNAGTLPQGLRGRRLRYQIHQVQGKPDIPENRPPARRGMPCAGLKYAYDVWFDDEP